MKTIVKARDLKIWETAEELCEMDRIETTDNYKKYVVDELKFLYGVAGAEVEKLVLDMLACFEEENEIEDFMRKFGYYTFNGEQEAKKFVESWYC